MSNLFTNVVILLATVSYALAAFEGDVKVGLLINNWKYVGCASEIPGRALQGSSFSDDRMTVESCQSYCEASNLPLAGVEYGRECYCGKALNSPSKLNAGDCEMSCAGNKRQFCGGPSRLSVYNLTTWTAPTPPPKVAGGWDYVSCFMEPMGRRALTQLVKAEDKMTVDTCTQACASIDLPYAGLEYGRECWCGKELSKDLQDASDPNCAMTCNMACGGNQNQICGGSGAIGVYRNKNLSKREDDVRTWGKRKGRFVMMHKTNEPLEVPKIQS